MPYKPPPLLATLKDVELVEPSVDEVLTYGAVTAEKWSNASGGGGGSVTYEEAWLTGADVPLAANTNTNAISLDLVAGTWVVRGQISLANTSAGIQGNYCAFLTETSEGAQETAIVGAESQHLNGGGAQNNSWNATFERDIVLAAESTIYMVVIGTQVGNIWHAGNFLTGVVTGITALKIA